MIAALRALAGASVLAVGFGGSANQNPPRNLGVAAAQIVNAGLSAEGGVLFVSVTADGAPYDVDASKLRTFVRPYAGDRAADVPWRELRVSLGGAAALPDRVTGGPPREFRIPVTFPEPPAAPGMYAVRVRLESGFARSPNGAEIQQKALPAGSQPVWWPDEGGDDRGLQVVKERLRGHAFYGYGGATVGCVPAWYREYDAWTPIPIRSVARERGRAVYLGTGRSNDGFSFLAIDPIVAMVDLPDTKLAHGWGGSGGVSPDGPCPALRFADPWYFDLSGTTVASPGGWPPKAVHAGMTRVEVRRSYGYPSGDATAAQLDQVNQWTYNHDARSTWSVTFANDRVVTVAPQAFGP
ncbi:MAG: hypothetical protein JWN27_2625 [Candidatus Eremiobacteraeota bacterium]|nr:hypothetical protein [Candidatus Eremiobacteraeota bacterium]